MRKKFEFYIQIVKTLPFFLFGRKEYCITIQNTKFWIYPRSDNLFVLNETWIKEEYLNKSILNQAKTIIDLGAYMGDFTIWVKKNFEPNLVIALEPSQELFRLLELNIKENQCSKGVKIYQEAIFSDNVNVGLKQGLFSAINTIKADSSGDSVQGKSLLEILNRDGIDVVDLIKIDIEGSEKYVLTDKNKNIFRNRVKFIMLEAHDLNGNDKEDSIKYFEDLGYNFDYFKVPWFFGIYRLVGENPLLVNK